jgi:hypothetical protein
MNFRSRIAVAAMAVFGLAASLFAQDAVTVGTVNTTASTVDVPVYIRDVAGTPLGKDRDPSSHIQAYSIKVKYSPASAVTSATFTRSGATADLSPSFESSPKTADSVSLLGTFPQATSPIPLVLGAPAPGTKVANIRLVLSSAAVAGTTIALELDPSLTQLTDEGGTAATKETAANGRLTLVHGAVNIQQAPITLSLSPSSRTIAVGGSVTMTVMTSAAVSAATTVTLTASTSAVSVPSSVVIAEGAQQATFTATAKGEGSAVITARLPSSAGSASATSTIAVSNSPACATPSEPHASGPEAARAGEPYAISWQAVANATEYVIEEASNASFQDAATTSTINISATFTRPAGTWFYRVRARNRAGNCDVTSARSAVVAVVISDAPVAAMRVIPVVGSTRGNAGSFFKTSVQLYNPTGDTISGRIVFHPQGTAGSSADPALAYSIAPGRTVAYDDLLPALGVPSGVGSADLIADIAGAASMPLPVTAVRIFNDAGAAGTTGLVQEPVRTGDALRAGDTGAIIAPADFAKFRLNVGVRSLGQGVAITITVRDRDGIIVASLDREYAPHLFEQTSSAAFLGGHALSGSETISILVTRGSAIVYGATTDNITNDPAQQFARRLD